jgi:hypothetical protein
LSFFFKQTNTQALFPLISPASLSSAFLSPASLSFEPIIFQNINQFCIGILVVNA